jgi:uncharacterized protein (TIGR00369 family)
MSEFADGWIELPQTDGCMVCGPGNPRGLRLKSHVQPSTGAVRLACVPGEAQCGFAGMVHGGALATLADEAMTWAASWHGKRFCVCGEMTVRYRRSAPLSESIVVNAKVESARPRLIQTSAEICDAAGELLATAAGKYVPMSTADSNRFMNTLVQTSATATARRMLLEPRSS